RSASSSNRSWSFSARSSNTWLDRSTAAGRDFASTGIGRATVSLSVAIILAPHEIENCPLRESGNAAKCFQRSFDAETVPEKRLLQVVEEELKVCPGGFLEEDIRPGDCGQHRSVGRRQGKIE